MTKLTTIGLSAALALAFAATAHAQSPQIPNPANPSPMNPIATDGSALPTDPFMRPVQTGRSAFIPVEGVLDASARAAGSIINVVPATADALTGR